MEPDFLEMIKWAIPFLAVGGAYGGAKQAINGTKHRVDKLEEVADRAQEKYTGVKTQLASVETKIDILLEKL